MHKCIKREQHLEAEVSLKAVYAFKNATVHKDVAGKYICIYIYISYIFLICKLIELISLFACS